jgi:hypothetical protein
MITIFTQLENGIPLWQHSYDIITAAKKYSWLNKSHFTLIKEPDLVRPDTIWTGDINFCKTRYPDIERLSKAHLSLPNEFLLRECGETVLETVDWSKPVFLKPVHLKQFTGGVFDNKKSFELFTGITDTQTPLIWSNVLEDINTEWRLWCHNKTILDARPYLGWKKVPDWEKVKEIVSWISKNITTEFVVDIGITHSDETFVIELNDVIATGTYGFSESSLITLLLKRGLY